LQDQFFLNTLTTCFSQQIADVASPFKLTGATGGKVISVFDVALFFNIAY